MKQHLSKFKNTGFLQSKKLFALLLMLFSTASLIAKVVSASLLTNGAVIRIYPYNHYGDINLSLACNGDGSELTSYEKSGSGNEWTLEYAGYGCYYLRNELGCYWGNQGKQDQKSLVCTTDKDKAEKVSFTDSASGINFWSDTEGIALNNLMGKNTSYNWWSTPENYYNDSNSTFEVMLIKQGDTTAHTTKEIEDNGLRFLIDYDFMTGKLLPNDYTGDIVVPHYVNYEGQDFEITSANLKYFNDCTSIDARYIDYEKISSIPGNIVSLTVGNVKSIGERAANYNEKLQSVSFGNIESIGNYAFAYCESLKQTNFNNVENIGEYAFVNCDGLQSASFDNVGSIGNNAFSHCHDLESVSFGNVENIEEQAFGYCRNLQSVSFCNVGKIGEEAFYYCESLQSASFNSIDSIERGAFVGCGKLLLFTFPPSLKKVGNYAFNSDNEITFKCYVKNPEDLSIGEYFNQCVKEFYVLKSSLEDYKNTIPWNDFADRILPMADVTVTKIELPETAVIKNKGSIVNISATVYPEDAENKTLKWSSSDETIATVDGMGNVMGIKAGEAIITAAATDGSGITATCTVTVEPTKIDNVSFFGMPTKLNVGEYVNDVKSKVVINPTDADYTDIAIETSDPNILRYYNTDKLLAKADGYVTVTAKVTAFDGTTKTTSMDITVGNPTNINETTSEGLIVKCRNKRLVVTGITSNEEITVENVAGQTIYKGRSYEVSLPASGIYFVKAKGNTIKIYAE